MEYDSAIKINEIMPFAATWIDPKIIILSKLRQRKTNIISLICGRNLKKKKEIIYKTEIDSHKKQLYSYQREKEGRDNLGLTGTHYFI